MDMPDGVKKRPMKGMRRACWECKMSPENMYLVEVILTGVFRQEAAASRTVEPGGCRLYS
jgi:hypothetical protein